MCASIKPANNNINFYDMILILHSNFRSEIEYVIYKSLYFFLQTLLIATIHYSSATFFPFASRSQPHAITYNIITANRPSHHPAYSVAINRSPHFVPLAPYYGGGARAAAAAAFHIQLTNTPHYSTARNEYVGGLTLPINAHSLAAIGYGWLQQPTAYAGLHGIPHVLASAPAPTPFAHHRSPIPVLFD